MSFHLHVFNLREDASNQDLRDLFSGISIKQDGVTIVGGPKGEAFVTFDSELDLLRAMQMDGEEHLKFKVATDVDKLRGINKMCIANLQKLKKTSSFTPGGSSEEDDDDNAQTNKDIEKGYRAKRSQSWERSESDSTYGAKRIRRDGSSHIDGRSDKDGPDRYNEREQGYSHAHAAQLPWPSSRQQRRPDPRFSSNVSTAHTPAHFREKASIPYRSTPLQFPYPPPVRPRLPYPTRGIQRGTKFNPVSRVRPQQKYVPRQDSTPSKDSLLMSLLPRSTQQRYCLQMSDLPPNVTPSLVWSWVGGPQGTALGVVLLKSSHDYPVAFLIYDSQFHRDQRFKTSTIPVAKFTALDTCYFITNFINSWTKWKGIRKLHSPIFETTFTGKDRYIGHRDFYNFAADCPTEVIPSNKSPKDSLAHDRKKVIEATKTKPAEKVQNPNISTKSPVEHSERMFLVVYNLKSTITATKILSWFDAGISALKLTFPEKDGPRDSEAMAVILFNSREDVMNAQSGVHGKDLITGQWRFADTYCKIYSYGDKCTITEATSTGDRVISPEERKQAPFLREVEILAELPNKDQFTLTDILNMKFLHLKGIAYHSAPKVIWNWYPTAKGIVIMKKRLPKEAPEAMTHEATEALIAFKTMDDLDKALKASSKVVLKATFKINWRTPDRIGRCKPPKKLSSQYKQMTSKGVIRLLSRSGFDIRISTERKQPDRQITLAEAKFIASYLPNMDALKSPTKSEATKSEATPAENVSMQDNSVYLELDHMTKEITACKLLALFPDALCALKVNYTGDAVSQHGSKASGYLLLKDARAHAAAKLLFENHSKTWRYKYTDSMVHTDVSKRHRFTQTVSRAAMKKLLSRICYKATISESTPSGIDRVLTLEELVLVPINPPFILVHDPPCLHYAQVTGDVKYISAGEIWDWLGGCNGQVKGVVLLVHKTDNKHYMAFVVFDSLEKLNNKNWFTGHWASFLTMTERQALGFLMGSTDDYVIKISTEMGPDRDLNPAEEELLGFPTKMEEAVTIECSSMATGKPSENKTIGEHNVDMTPKEQREDKTAGRSSDDRSTKIQSFHKPAIEKCNDKTITEQGDDKAKGEESGIKVVRGQRDDNATEDSDDMVPNELVDETPIKKPSDEISMKQQSFDEPVMYKCNENDENAIREQSVDKKLEESGVKEIGDQRADNVTGEPHENSTIVECIDDMLSKEPGDDKTIKRPSDERSTKQQTFDEPIMQRYDENAVIGQSVDKATGAQNSGTAIRGQRDNTSEEEQHDKQSTEELLDKSVIGKSIGPSEDIKCEFYIRLKKVPIEVKTACELLSLFNLEGGQGKIATLVRDCNGVGISAYIMFDEANHRDSALLKHSFAVRCSAYGRAARLAEFDPEYEILESTNSGKDRVLSAEERDGLEEQFNQ